MAETTTETPIVDEPAGAEPPAAPEAVAGADAPAATTATEAPEQPAAPVDEPVPTPRHSGPANPGAATGRRKEAVARVRLVPGTGRWDINGRALDAYFPNKVHQQLVSEPFKTADLTDRFDVIARVTGGGVSGQAGALRLGISRALTSSDGENRPVLKKAGMLTRDARVKERKKYGLKKARKAPQYSKR